VPPGTRHLGVQVAQGPLTTVQLPVGPPVQVPAWRHATLLVDGQPAGTAQHAHGFNSLISWSGLDIGLDRGSPVSLYEAPFAFTGRLRHVTVTLDAGPGPDSDAVAQAELARQ
jgi:arylsulfatase